MLCTTFWILLTFKCLKKIVKLVIFLSLISHLNVLLSFSVDFPAAGPMVWYQKFEYAVGHWLQKTAEHVFGSVLCSPGCFSLFRGSALMDDNVLKRYTTTATRASEYVQYDQGLCARSLTDAYNDRLSVSSDGLWVASVQGRIAGCVLCCCSKAGVLNTMLHRTHTPTLRRSLKSFTTRGDDGDRPRWPTHWTSCTGLCSLCDVRFC